MTASWKLVQPVTLVNQNLVSLTDDVVDNSQLEVNVAGDFSHIQMLVNQNLVSLTGQMTASWKLVQPVMLVNQNLVSLTGVGVDGSQLEVSVAGNFSHIQTLVNQNLVSLTGIGVDGSQLEVSVAGDVSELEFSVSNWCQCR